MKFLIFVSETAESQIKGLADYKTGEVPSWHLGTYRVERENSAIFNSYKGSSNVMSTTCLSSSHLPQVPVS